MAATAQDPSAPLRAEKKDEDRDEDSAHPDRAPACPGLCVDDQSEGPGQALRRVRSICMHPLCTAAEASCLRRLRGSGVLAVLRHREGRRAARGADLQRPAHRPAALPAGLLQAVRSWYERRSIAEGSILTVPLPRRSSQSCCTCCARGRRSQRCAHRAHASLSLAQRSSGAAGCSTCASPSGSALVGRCRLLGGHGATALRHSAGAE